jgi:hypothetical protein
MSRTSTLKKDVKDPLILAPSIEVEQLDHALAQQGYAVMLPSQVARWAACDLAALQALIPAWDDMPLDNYLKDGGHYRRRRHSCFEFKDQALTQVPHRAHWQSLDYNALHGGMQRWFEPISTAVVNSLAWRQVLSAMARTCDGLRGSVNGKWCIEAHQFRIDTSEGIGRPTPEGAHRDGVDFVAVFLLNRYNIKGGETRVFDAHGPQGERFTLTEPWSLLFLADARVIHESTPIQPLQAGGYRDTLVLTCRANVFQTEQT